MNNNTQFKNARKLVIKNFGSGKGDVNKTYDNLIKTRLANYIFRGSALSIIEYDINNDNLCHSKKDFEDILKSDNYDIIIIIGGDGTVHSVVNVLMKNNLLGKKPICHLPGGTGNGLSKSLHYSKNSKNSKNKSNKLQSENKFNMNSAIQDMLKFELQPINIFQVVSSDNKLNEYGFLSLTWGLFSDIDIKTEKLRWLGSFRNKLGAVWELIRKHSYQGELSYINDDGSWTTIVDQFYYLTASNVSHVCHDVFINPDIELNDGKFHLGFLRGKSVSRFQILKLMLSFDYGTCDKYLESVRTEHFILKIRSGIVVLDGERIDDKIDLDSSNNKQFSVKMLKDTFNLF